LILKVKHKKKGQYPLTDLEQYPKLSLWTYLSQVIGN